MTVLSPDRKYRYRLTRLTGLGGGIVNFIMLNPSTADAEKDDPTIRRCIGFAKARGYGRLVVTNLFALRSTNPAELMKAQNPMGEDNPYWLTSEIDRADRVVAAWGAHGLAVAPGQHLRAYCKQQHITLSTLGLTKQGAPRHPLYVPASTPFHGWPEEQRESLP